MRLQVWIRIPVYVVCEPHDTRESKLHAHFSCEQYLDSGIPIYMVSVRSDPVLH